MGEKCIIIYMKKKKVADLTVENRKARFDYHLMDEIVCGMVLDGDEVRLIRDHHAQLKGSYVAIRNGELWLYGLTLGAETRKDIKLLATKKQIRMLEKEKTIGKTIVPVRLLGGERHIKLVIALAQGKKKYDKRETVKKRDIERGRW